jgi:macrolide-specific efflux system membrane fusion protein
MRLWPRSILLLNATLAVLTVAGAGWGYQTVFGTTTAAASSTNQRQRSVAVTEGVVTSTVSAPGTVQSVTMASANFLTTGTVTDVSVKVGDAVTKGQVLAKVDASAAQDQLNTAQANLTAAQQSLSRAQAASSDAATIANASAQVTSAQSTVDAARRTVAGTVLASPIAGTVIAVNGSVGSPSGGGSSSTGTGATSGGSGATSGGTGTTAGGSGSSSSAAGSGTGSGASTGFIQIADLSAMQVSANFAEADATKLKAGQTAAVAWSALSGARASGQVSAIAPTATTLNNVNSYAVLISLDTIPAGARLGQSTTVQVTVAQADNVLRVPTTAIRTAGGQRTVLVVAGTGTQVRQVEQGVRGDQYTEITAGLAVGDQVVVTLPTTGTTTNTPPGGGFGGGGLRGGGGGGGG